jgi:hypothetical protein
MNFKGSVRLAAALVIVFGCKNSTEEKIPDELNNDQQIVMSDSVKPVLTTTLKNLAEPLIFEAAFDSTTSVSLNKEHFSFSTYTPGNITIESGKIIACDIIMMQDWIAFSETFPTGTFPVQTSLAINNNDTTVSFCRILFSNAAVARWEFALQPGQPPAKLKDTIFYCYSVDAGQAIFADSIANRAIHSGKRTLWSNEQNMHAADTSYIYKFDNHSIAVFTTGYGDGCYSAYIGYDSTNQICRLLTDFNVVPWWR